MTSKQHQAQQHQAQASRQSNLEVAELLSVSVAWVRDHSSRRRPYLPVVRLGKAVRFRRSDVEEFIRQCSQTKGAIP